MNSWRDITPEAAQNIDCTRRPDLNPPLNENGEVCPWPWDPQTLAGHPIGQYHCRYCGAMCAAGAPHPDYSPTAHPLIGKHVTVTYDRGIHPHGPMQADATATGILTAATYDGEAHLKQPDGTTLHVWPALDITETDPA